MDCEVRADGSRFASLRGVTKRVADHTVLRDLDLTIPRGGFVSLVGPSGCGKSTVLRLLAGLTAPSSGIVELGAAGSTTRIAYVFQDAALMPWRTVLANVELPLQLNGVGRTQRRAAARAALERVGLGARASAYPLELSGGMAMRVSLARALVNRPQVLLLDEPFAALDEISRLTLNDELLRLWRNESFTAVFVTHSVSEAVYLSQSVCLMAPHPGRIVAEYAIDLPADLRAPGWREQADYCGYVRTITARLTTIVTP